MSGTRQSIVIIGGGASGVLLAANLLRDNSADARVTLIEQRGQLGRGLAYSALQQNHVLNVPATGMSAFADDPDHFWRWLRDRGLVAANERFVFVPRRHYGVYLAEILAQSGGQDGRLNVIEGTAVDVRVTAAGAEVLLANGTSVIGHSAVLAVGHEENPPRAQGIAVRVGSDADTPLPLDAEVVLLGSGLSMVDAWLTLAHAGHRGPITVVSRHGLLPKSHRQVEKLALEPADVPFGTDITYFEHWFRDVVNESRSRGGDWRGVVDALRPFNQRIWQNWTEKSRKRFLTHLRPFWNIHRHRMPPDLHARLAHAVESGQVRLRAGTVTRLERSTGGVRATVRQKATGRIETLEIARVYDCGGVTVDVEQSSNPVVQRLVQRGDARPDALHIGLDVSIGCQVINRTGTASPRLFAIGPLTRGTFFEIEAIPDIRVQAASLSQRLLDRTEPAVNRRVR